jgi:uncharacterized protein YndB with AHSA1/START domain
MKNELKTVQVGRHFDESAERVFHAWLDPKAASKFLFATADGEVVRSEIDARVGGQFLFTDRRPEAGDVDHKGEYLEIDRPRRLVFTFAVPAYSPDYTTVTIDIVPSGKGSELVLTHEGVLAEYHDQTVSGWSTILEGPARSLG